MFLLFSAALKEKNTEKLYPRACRLVALNRKINSNSFSIKPGEKRC